MPELVDLEEYQRERDRIIAEFDKKIADLETEILTLEQEIVDVEGQISSWRTKKSEAQTKVNSLNSELFDLNNIYSTVSHIPGMSYQTTWYWPDHFEDAKLRVFALPIDIDRDGIQELHNISWTEYQYCANWWQIGRPEITIECYRKWLDAMKAEVSKFKAIVDAKRDELSAATSELSSYTSQLSAAESSLESKTRHMRDLQLAKEGAEEEKRGALALWEVDWQAAQERRRIEIGSIARDIALGFPTMEAEEAQRIAETAYGDALTRGFTRLSDAIRIASDLADEWWDRQIYPHLTTTTIRCPSCNAQLELTSSDIPEHNRVLNCPQCGAYVDEGFSLRWVYEPVPPIPPIAGMGEWLKKYGPWVGLAGAGAVTLYVALKKR